MGTLPCNTGYLELTGCHRTCSQPGPQSQAGCESEYRTPPHSQITPSSPHSPFPLLCPLLVHRESSREQQDLQDCLDLREEAGFKPFADLRPTQDIFETSLYKSAAFLSAPLTPLCSPPQPVSSLPDIIYLWSVSPRPRAEASGQQRRVFAQYQNNAWYITEHLLFAG